MFESPKDSSGVGFVCELVFMLDPLPDPPLLPPLPPDHPELSPDGATDGVSDIVVESLLGI